MTSYQKRLVAAITLPVVVAAFIRLITYQYISQSPFLFFNDVPGLDMQTIIRQGLQFYDRSNSFSWQNLLIALNTFVNNGAFAIKLHLALQFTAGIAIVILTFLISRQLFRNLSLCCLAALLAAIYAPALMYECFALKATFFTFFCLLSLYALLKEQNARSNWTRLAYGAVFLSPFFVRDTSLVWLGLGLASLFIPKKLDHSLPKHLLKCTKKHICFMLGMLALFCLITLINTAWTGRYLSSNPFNRAYNIKLGAQQQPGSMSCPDRTSQPSSSRPTRHSLKRLFHSYSSKVIISLKAYEQTNNLNYYFMRPRLYPLAHLLPPIILVPLALTGFLLIVFKKSTRRRFLPATMYMLSMLLPMWIFIPLSRYKLLLYPIFCLLAAYFIMYCFIKLKSGRHYRKCVTAIVIYLFIFYAVSPSTEPVRASDFQVLGRALRLQHGQYTPAVGDCYIQAYKLNPSDKYLMPVIDFLLATGHFHKAQSILLPFLQQNSNKPVFTLKLAITYLATGNPHKAEIILAPLEKTLPPQNMADFCYNMAEAKLMQNQSAVALSYYRKALQNSVHPKLNKMIQQRIRQLTSATK